MIQVAPLFARQAIYDKNRNVIAYELLFRHSDANYAGDIDGDHATSNVLLNVLGSHPIEEFVGNKKAFINFTANLLKKAPPLPADKLVIEVLEDIEAERDILEALKNLKKNGFDIALDDFFITKDTKKMMSYANIIKVDVLALSNEKLKKYVDVLKPLNIKLLAEKVEDHEMMERCVDLGFDWFQGYFLCKPEIVKGVKISEGKHAVLQLIAKLNNPDTPFEEIVDTIATDPSLSYKIMRLVNSSAMGLPREIQSLSQAVSILGVNNIKNWANFLLLANSENKPRELCSITLSRAKFCEKLGHAIEGKALSESAFTTGLLSTLDAYLDMSTESLLKKLQLSKDIEYALMAQQGLLGKILQIALSYEKGKWPDVDWEILSEYGLTPEKLNELYVDSLAWATQTVNSNV